MQTTNITNPIQPAPFSKPTSYAGIESTSLAGNLPTHRKVCVLKSANSYECLDLMLPPLKENHVLIRVEASPISPLDCLCICGYGGLMGLGYSAQPFTLGFEGTGVVVGCGSGSEAQRLLNKRVAGISFDGGFWGDYNILRVDEVFPLDDIPATITTEEAAGLVMNPMTAMMFLDIARKKGVRAIVNTAASSVLGRFVNRLFMKNGLEVINIVKSKEKADELRKDGAVNVLVEGETDFYDNFKILSDRLGIGMIFDATGGEMATKLLDCAPYGTRLIIYGLMSEKSVITLPLGTLFARKSIKSCLLFRWLAKRSREENVKIFKEVIQSYNTVFKTDIIRSFPMTSIKDGVSFYESHKKDHKGGDGKVILRCIQRRSPLPKTTREPDGTEC
eukprot:TRINITY_DN12573_c0_g1_i2.p2 TRINITY_DN12573_c0_g1~~TRINITY_DN12573_c0_g1_i2.p2  ORF type:complete len:390 (+),score=112.97 TRINITY_DN12573_c0_g1_i2:185-1354(+)